MDNESIGFVERRLQFARPVPKGGGMEWHYFSKAIPLYAKIFSDFASTTLPLLPDMAVRLELGLNPGSFYLQSGDSDAETLGYHLKIESAALMVPVKVMAPSLALSLEKKLLTQPIHYPLKRIESKKFSISGSLQNFQTDQLVQSSVNPNRLLVFFIKSQFWDGGYKVGPFFVGLLFSTGLTKNMFDLFTVQSLRVQPTFFEGGRGVHHQPVGRQSVAERHPLGDGPYQQLRPTGA